jgi:transposase
MPKTYHISEEDSQKLRQEMKQCKNVRAYRRLEAVALRGEGKNNAEIGALTGYYPDSVSKFVSLYVNEGIESLLEDRRRGGNHRNLSAEEEHALLQEFYDTAAEGQIITPADIKKRYDELLGRETKPNFIYAVLARNGWRKVMPRSKHPNKASDEAIEASKKLTLKSED